GTLRAFSSEVLAKAFSRLQEIVEGGAVSLGGSGKLIRHIGYPPLINNKDSCGVALKAARAFLPVESVVYPGDRGLYGEDFAYYLQKVPGCFAMLGCRNESKGCIYPLHHPHFDLDEECMKVGVRFFFEILNG
ncbi:MAG: M20/M25/M40 family metallo-hydrolase, partial [Chlamydiia bacterium]|nr:M20/M25/M40 family metallo-hydrolase [Chlamydiia bacterium]